MIFSKQKMDKAFTYMSKYYNKILLINLDDDTFELIKINDKELETLNKTNIKTYTGWIECFFNSPFYSSLHSNESRSHVINSIVTLRSIEKLRNVTTPITISYMKVIDCEFHEVMLEYIPIEDNKSLLFVKDLYLMKKGIYNNED